MKRSICILGSTGRRHLARLKVFAIILIVSLTHATRAVTLQAVLQTTLDRNPAIQEAKSGLEQAAGQRLVFRSVVWPDAELSVPRVFRVATAPVKAE